MINYLKKLILFSAIILIFSFLVFQFPLLKPFQSFVWYSISFFTFLSFITHFILTKGMSEKSSNSFLTFVYLAIFAKMILCVLAVLAYFFIEKPEKIYFIIPFFLLYICYTSFDTIHLVQKSKNIKPS